MFAYAHISFPEDLGQAIREERKAQGLSQMELATRSGCSQRFVSEVERGKQGAEMGKVLQLLRALGLSIRLTGQHTPEQSRELVETGVARIGESLGSAMPPRRKLADFLGE